MSAKLPLPVKEGEKNPLGFVDLWEEYLFLKTSLDLSSTAVSGWQEPSV